MTSNREIWPAVASGLFGSRADVGLEGSILTLRSKRSDRRFDLGAGQVEVTRHQWQMAEGTALGVRQGDDIVFIAGREAFFPELRHEREALVTPELVMTASDFTSFQDAVTVGHPWWPGLMQALTAACAANQPGFERK